MVAARHCVQSEGPIPHNFATFVRENNKRLKKCVIFLHLWPLGPSSEPRHTRRSPQHAICANVDEDGSGIMVCPVVFTHAPVHKIATQFVDDLHMQRHTETPSLHEFSSSRVSSTEHLFASFGRARTWVKIAAGFDELSNIHPPTFFWGGKETAENKAHNNTRSPATDAHVGHPYAPHSLKSPISLAKTIKRALPWSPPLQRGARFQWDIVGVQSRSGFHQRGAVGQLHSSEERERVRQRQL